MVTKYCLEWGYMFRAQLVSNSPCLYRFVNLACKSLLRVKMHLTISESIIPLFVSIKSSTKTRSQLLLLARESFSLQNTILEHNLYHQLFPRLMSMCSRPPGSRLVTHITVVTVLQIRLTVLSSIVWFL